MDQFEVAEILIGVFCVCVAAFVIYLLYVCYLKKFRGYKYDNGVPKVAILRQSRFGSVGMKHFSAAAFRTSQISVNSADGKNPNVTSDAKRPHTFPLTSSSNISNLPEIRVEHVV